MGTPNEGATTTPSTRRVLLRASGLKAGTVAIAIAACTDAGVSAVTDAGPDGPGTIDAGFAESGSADAGDAGTCTPPDAAMLDPAQVQLGKSLVLSHSCPECHGLALSGNATGISMPGGGMAYPPNLTPHPTAGLGCWSDDQIENAILFGIANDRSHLCSPMPAFANQGVDVLGAHAIVQFLRSIPASSAQIPDTMCPSDHGGADGGSDADAGDASDASDAHARSDARADSGDAAGDAAGDASSDAESDAADDADAEVDSGGD